MGPLCEGGISATMLNVCKLIEFQSWKSLQIGRVENRSLRRIKYEE